MGIKQLYNDNLRKLPNKYGDVSVMCVCLQNQAYQSTETIACQQRRTDSVCSFSVLGKVQSQQNYPMYVLNYMELKNQCLYMYLSHQRFAFTCLKTEVVVPRHLKNFECQNEGKYASQM